MNRRSDSKSASRAGQPDLVAPLRGASLGQAVERFWRKYATFRGRASRSEYWYAILGNLLVVMALNVVEVIAILALSREAGVLIFTVLFAVFSLATLVPAISVGARRLHDVGRSGWFQLLGVIPILGTLLLILMLTRPENPSGDRYNV